MEPTKKKKLGNTSYLHYGSNGIFLETFSYTWAYLRLNIHLKKIPVGLFCMSVRLSKVQPQHLW